MVSLRATAQAVVVVVSALVLSSVATAVEAFITSVVQVVAVVLVAVVVTAVLVDKGVVPLSVSSIFAAPPVLLNQPS